MPIENFPYDCVIEAGQSEINDRCHAFLKTKLFGRWLDVGCNTGWLLSEAPNGTGIDACKEMVEKAQAKGLNAFHCWAENLPFEDQFFDLAVISNTLEHTKDSEVVLREVMRVSNQVIGICAKPGSRWGKIWGWVQSITPEEKMHALGFKTESFDDERYYFEWQRECVEVEKHLEPLPENRYENDNGTPEQI